MQLLAPQTVCDDKSGYDHILLAPSSRTYFGFQWDGWYFISNTIPFGWKLSAYVYHSTGLLVSHYFRSIGIPCSLYIDDRHSSQIRLTRESSLVQSLDPEKVNLVSAQIASFLVCYTLVRLGYCIGLQKSRNPEIQFLIWGSSATPVCRPFVSFHTRSRNLFLLSRRS